jgi:hypothetical protein
MLPSPFGVEETFWPVIELPSGATHCGGPLLPWTKECLMSYFSLARTLCW